MVIIVTTLREFRWHTQLLFVKSEMQANAPKATRRRSRGVSHVQALPVHSSAGLVIEPIWSYRGYLGLVGRLNALCEQNSSLLRISFGNHLVFLLGKPHFELHTNIYDST